MANEFKVKNGIKFADNTVQTTAAVGGSGLVTISDKTGTYTVVSGDLGSIINCTSGTFTVSLTAAATLGSGFYCWIWNTGTGVISIDPNGTETVDGVDPTTEFKLTQGTGIKLTCTGSAWLTSDVRSSGDASIGILGVQLGRNSSGDMAVAKTGQGAVALGGSYAQGVDSFATAIGNNTSSYGALGPNSIAMGSLAKTNASFSYGVAIGNFANASGTHAISLGYNSLASGATHPIAIGGNTTASGSHSTAINGGNIGNAATSNYSIVIGAGARVDTVIGKYAYSSAGSFAGTNTGDAQAGKYVLRAATTDNTATVLTTNGSAVANSNIITLPNTSAFAFTGIIIARRKSSDGTQSAAWRIEGIVRRESTAASVTLVNSAITVLDNQPGWNIAVGVNTTHGSLTITGTGATATNIRWVASIETSEVIYA